MESRLRCSLGFLGLGSEAWAAAFLRRLGPGVPPPPGVDVEEGGGCEDVPMGVLLPVEEEEPRPEGPDGGRGDICVVVGCVATFWLMWLFCVVLCRWMERKCCVFAWSRDFCPCLLVEGWWINGKRGNCSILIMKMERNVLREITQKFYE